MRFVLGSDIGQKNINNDPRISDFNELTIADKRTNVIIQYYQIIIVRKGDIKKEKNWVHKNMEEEEIYLIDNYNKGLSNMEKKLPIYLKQIKKEINLKIR